MFPRPLHIPGLAFLVPLAGACVGKTDTGQNNLGTDSDGDGFYAGDDCDDADPTVHPDATEICDGIDNDCDALIDDDDDSLDSSTATVFHPDDDGDGFGEATTAVTACVQPSGTVVDGTDCDDGNADVNPDATEICDPDDVDEDCSGAADDADPDVDTATMAIWYTDADGDGFGDPDAPSTSCDPASDTVEDGTDCDDGNADVNPDATEVCDPDDVDEDCSGAADDADPGVDAASHTTWYTDADTDGFGDPATATDSCEPPSGTVEDGTDCDDTDGAVNPDATEVCDPDDVDEDCSGLADDDDPDVDSTTQTTTRPDTDGDGFGDAAAADTLYCDPPAGWVEDATDCDDTDTTVNPDATEVCDPDDVDEDCSGTADDDDSGVDSTTLTASRPDSDGDGFGDATAADVFYCDLPSGMVADDTDCDDGDIAINPDATEVCDAANVDEDCNGAADDDDSGVDTSTYTDWYPDGDGDGYGDASASPTPSCDSTTGVTDDTDCDDTNDEVHPAATEICDTVDNDCDAATSHAGMVTFTDATGTASDVTSTFSGGSASAPAAVPVTAAGDYAFCDGTFYTHIDATADASFRGVDGSVVLDGAGLDTVLTVSGSGVSVQVEDLSIESGLASALSSMGYLAGGGVACVNADEVTLLNVEVRNNEGETGAGLYVGDCDLYLDAGIIEDNVSDIAGGGIVAEGTSSVNLMDSLVSANTSSWAGGMLVAGPGPVEIDGTLFDGNIAGQASAASFVDFSGATTSISCSGSATAPAGFINNMYDPTHGGSGAAVEFGDSAGALGLTASNCDFGTLAAGDSNEGGALSHMAADWLLRVGDAMSFTCTESGCGTQTTHALADPTAIGQYSADDQLRGNIFLATAAGTIDSAGMMMNPDSSCTLDYYVLSNSALTATGWTLEHGETGGTSGGFGWRSHGSHVDWGLPTEPGRYYATLTGWNCSTTGETVEFELQGSGGTPVDSALGSHIGTVSMGGYAGSLASSGVSLTFTATTEQYGGTMVVTAF